jgi:dienelactone hydrolase
MRKLLLVLLLATPLAAQLEKPVVLRLAGMDDVDVRKNVLYDGDRKFDFYRPKGAGTLPLVIFLNGVGRPDLKEWGQYTSWPRLVAVRGMAAISYETTGNDVAPQTGALLRYVREHAGELKIDPKRIAIWGCSANVRLGTGLLASHDDFRAAVFYYGLMEIAPKNILTPVLVTRAGMDALPLNSSIDRWVAQAVEIEAPVTLITYPEGLHAFELENDTPESRQIVAQTLDFLQFHLTTAPTPRREPMTLAQFQKLFASDRAAALARLKELRGTHPDAYILRESILNGLGYALMSDNKPAEAVAILELVAATYPDSANAHDSLGDAYEAAGRPADAIRESERALALLDKVQGRQRDAIQRSAEDKLTRLRK